MHHHQLGSSSRPVLPQECYQIRQALHTAACVYGTEGQSHFPVKAWSASPGLWVELHCAVQAGARQLEAGQAAERQAAREGEELRAQIEVDADREVELQRERCACTSLVHACMLGGVRPCSSHCLVKMSLACLK